MTTKPPSAPLEPVARLFQPFHKLRWKLTWSYALVTGGALIALELLVLLVAGILITRQARELFPRAAAELAAEVALYLAETPVDTAGLNRWLTQLEARSYSNDTAEGELVVIELARDESAGVLVVVDARGEVAASTNTAALAVGSPFRASLTDAAAEHLGRALAGEASAKVPFFLFLRPLVAAAPVVVEGQVLGATFIRIDAMTGNPFGRWGLLWFLGLSLLLVAIFALPVGALFGFLNARWLTRRLSSLASVAETWSRGDFSRSANDTSSDELGQLARRLNQMADELQALLLTRQELATLEERNRLARDLHDSVKQQLFATSMQIGAAKVLLEQRPQKAAEHLAEADALAHQVQGELAGLIHALRPAALGGRDLDEALGDYLDVWSRHNGVEVMRRLDKVAFGRHLALEQALYRVVQEALANVAKHSRAARVTVSLHANAKGIEMCVADDGVGFGGAEFGTEQLDLKQQGRSVGLASMRERVGAFGGTLLVSSRPGEGTTITARVPTNPLEGRAA